MLSTRNLALKGSPSRKLAAKFVGPYTIVARYGSTAYKLQIPESLKIHPVFHISLLKKYEGFISQPDPVELEKYQEFEIEDIIGHAVRQGRMHYLVRWAGYDNSHN